MKTPKQNLIEELTSLKKTLESMPETEKFEDNGHVLEDLGDVLASIRLLTFTSDIDVFKMMERMGDTLEMLLERHHNGVN